MEKIPSLKHLLQKDSDSGLVWDPGVCIFICTTQSKDGPYALGIKEQTNKPKIKTKQKLLEINKTIKI